MGRVEYKQYSIKNRSMWPHGRMEGQPHSPLYEFTSCSLWKECINTRSLQNKPNGLLAFSSLLVYHFDCTVTQNWTKGWWWLMNSQGCGRQQLWLISRCSSDWRKEVKKTTKNLSTQQIICKKTEHYRSFYCDTNNLELEIHLNNIYKFSSDLTVKTHCLSITKTNQLKQFRDVTGVYSESHMKPMNMLCGKNVNFLKCYIRWYTW
jgi:hypothetical protein